VTGQREADQRAAARRAAAVVAGDRVAAVRAVSVSHRTGSSVADPDSNRNVTSTSHGPPTGTPEFCSSVTATSRRPAARYRTRCDVCSRVEGEDVAKVQAQLGHSDPTTTRRIRSKAVKSAEAARGFCRLAPEPDPRGTNGVEAVHDGLHADVASTTHPYVAGLRHLNGSHRRPLPYHEGRRDG
jgi:hypothetical protein